MSLTITLFGIALVLAGVALFFVRKPKAAVPKQSTVYHGIMVRPAGEASVAVAEPAEDEPLATQLVEAFGAPRSDVQWSEQRPTEITPAIVDASAHDDSEREFERSQSFLDEPGPVNDEAPSISDHVAYTNGDGREHAREVDEVTDRDDAPIRRVFDASHDGDRFESQVEPEPEHEAAETRVLAHSSYLDDDSDLPPIPPIAAYAESVRANDTLPPAPEAAPELSPNELWPPFEIHRSESVPAAAPAPVRETIAPARPQPPALLVLEPPAKPLPVSLISLFSLDKLPEAIAREIDNGLRQFAVFRAPIAGTSSGLDPDDVDDDDDSAVVAGHAETPMEWTRLFTSDVLDTAGRQDLLTNVLALGGLDETRLLSVYEQDVELRGAFIAALDRYETDGRDAVFAVALWDHDLAVDAFDALMKMRAYGVAEQAFSVPSIAAYAALKLNAVVDVRGVLAHHVSPSRAEEILVEAGLDD